MPQMTALSEAPFRASTREPAVLVRRPLHLRLREQILRDMVKADLSPGQRYSTEGELAERFRVSRNTLRKAMSGLEKEGYLSRRRRVGAIAGRRLLPERGGAMDEAAPARRRAIVILPGWDDSVEGRFAGQVLRALASPDLSPPLTVEIRHPNDPLTLSEVSDAVIVALDPRNRAVHELQEIAQKGARVIVYGPEAIWPEFVMIGDNRREDTRKAVLHLYNIGHEAVGLVNHDPSHLAFSQSLLGYLDAHQELGRNIPVGGLVQRMNGIPGSGAPDLPRISGWVCAYLAAAKEIGGKCKELGLSIPEDVSVVTLDDPGDIVLPELGKPLTAIRENFAQAASLIHAFIHNWSEDQRGKITQVCDQWIERATTATPRRNVGS